MSVALGVIYVIAAFAWVRYVLAISLVVEYGMRAVDIYESTCCSVL